MITVSSHRYFQKLQSISVCSHWTASLLFPRLECHDWDRVTTSTARSSVNQEYFVFCVLCSTWTVLIFKVFQLKNVEGGNQDAEISVSIRVSMKSRQSIGYSSTMSYGHWLWLMCPINPFESAHFTRGGIIGSNVSYIQIECGAWRDLRINDFPKAEDPKVRFALASVLLSSLVLLKIAF